MEHNVQNWFKTTKSIYSSVLLASISGIVAGILSIISHQSQSYSLTTEGSLGTNLFIILLWLSHLVFIAGTFMYLLNIGKMQSLVLGRDSVAFRQIRTGLIVVIIAAVVVMFHIPQWHSSVWISAIVDIVGYVIIMVGFNTLRKSEAMSVKAKNGFRLAFIAMICFALGATLLLLFSWIPYAGVVFSVVAIMLSLAGFILITTGWNIIKNAMPPVR